MDPHAHIFVAGGGTLTGAALRRRLAAGGFCRLVGAGEEEPDPTRQEAVEHFFERVRPEYVFVTAGKTAGIAGNQRAPAELMCDNLEVAGHIVPAAWRFGVRKLLYLASSCVYPKYAPQPLRPESLWSGPLEQTSAAYAVAKLAGITLCQAFRQQHGAPFVTAISADAYGPGDDCSLENSHVIPGLLRRIHNARVSDAPTVEIWGSGRPVREFLYADDLADACIFTMEHHDDDAPLNLGTGVQTSIADLAVLVQTVVGYRGELRFDTSKPDGIPFKGLDSSRIHSLGWQPSVDLREGLERTYRDFLGRVHQTRGTNL